jgi:protein-S-isoprenylcysteine O-methyltransferase Ste14
MNENMISESMATEGQWLFRHRGVLPALLLIPGVWTLSHFQFLGGSPVWQNAWDWMCFGVSVCGLLVRSTTVGFVCDGTSGRNTRRQIASELNTTGWYSVCRNPLYLGNFLIMLGIIMVPGNIAYLAVCACSFWIYYERIIAAEESFLYGKFGAQFTEWSRATPVFFPRLQCWKAPAHSLRWRMVLRREYSSVLLIGIAFFLLNILEYAFAEHRLQFESEWAIMFTLTVAIYLTLRSLKKYTTLLQV